MFVGVDCEVGQEPSSRPRFAPKLPVGWIVQLYRRDALGITDDELMDRVGGRLYARCLDVIAISRSRVQCPLCHTEFEVPWINQATDLVARCSGCNWSITAAAYHASFEHQDLLGINAVDAFEGFIADYTVARNYRERMLAVDGLVHAIHIGGNTVMRNLVEGRPKEVLAVLDRLARRNE